MCSKCGIALCSTSVLQSNTFKGTTAVRCKTAPLFSGGGVAHVSTRHWAGLRTRGTGGVPLQSAARGAIPSNAARTPLRRGKRYLQRWNVVQRATNVKVTNLKVRSLLVCQKERIWLDAPSVRKRLVGRLHATSHRRPGYMILPWGSGDRFRLPNQNRMILASLLLGFQRKR